MSDKDSDFEAVLQKEIAEMMPKLGVASFTVVYPERDAHRAGKCPGKMGTDLCDYCEQEGMRFVPDGFRPNGARKYKPV